MISEKRIIEVNFTYPIKGEEIDFTAEIEAIFVTEVYGDDADGNRGEIRESVDDFEIISIIDRVFEEDMTEALKDNEEVREAIFESI